MKGTKNSKAKIKKIERKLQELKMNAGWEKVSRPFLPIFDLYRCYSTVVSSWPV